MPRLPQIIPLLLGAAAVAGCGANGGHGSAPATVTSAKKQVALYLAAFDHGDGKAACALLTPKAQAGVPHLSDQLKSPDCEGAIRELARASERLRAPRITVREQGDQAIAKIRNTHLPRWTRRQCSSVGTQGTLTCIRVYDNACHAFFRLSMEG